MLMLISSTISAGATAKFTHFPPSGLGSIHTYTVWDKIRWGGDCRKLINFAKENDALGDTYGIVKYGEWWAGATTSTLGNVGDLLLVVQTNGTVYPVIIADIKNQRDKGCTVWGHQNGKCMVEFEVLSSMRKFLYGSSGGYITDNVNQPIYKVHNLGSVYDQEVFDKYFYNPEQAVLDNGLEGYYLLSSPYEGEYVVRENVFKESPSTLTAEESLIDK